jgi:hypothetical protein
MSIFSNLSNEGLEETQDRLGGFQVYDTDAYDTKIKLAYAGVSAGGARSMNFVFAMPGGGELRTTEWVTNRKGENFFLNKDDQTKKVALPGWTIFEDICLVTVEKEPKDLVFEEKVINLYDFDQKKEVPTTVQMAVELIGQDVTLGVGKVLENKSVKVGDKYEPTADTREVNVVEKVFHTESKGTVVEARSNQTPGSFYTKWVERNQGKLRDKREIKDGAAGTAGRPGAPAGGPPQAGTQAPKKSLFGGNTNS